MLNRVAKGPACFMGIGPCYLSECLVLPVQSLLFFHSIRNNGFNRYKKLKLPVFIENGRNIKLSPIRVSILLIINNICSDELSFGQSFDEALKVLQTKTIDVVFSDINMPGLSGLNVLKNLTYPPPFVFITSYPDYAIEGFNLDAIDFVLKPVTFERLKKAAEKAFEYIALKAAARNSPSAGPNEIIAAENPADDHFFIRETKGITRLRYSEVLYFESMGDFSKIYKTDGQSHIILSGLKSLEGQLPNTLFKRVHKQYIINMDYLQTIARGEVFLTNRTSIPVSTVYKEEITTAFINKDPIKRN